MKKLICAALAVVLLLSLAGCEGASVKMDMQAVYTDICKSVQVPEMLELNEDLMLDYCGIRAEDVSQAMVLICADSLRTDEIWLLEAVDAKAASRLMELAEKRLNKKGEESVTYSPEQYKVVEKAQLIQAGNCVALLVSPDSEAMAQVFNQAAGQK